MRKCPECNAEIEENARFCLYCMAQLSEKHIIEVHAKKRRYRLALVVGLLCVAVGFTVWFLPKSILDKDNNKKENTDLQISNTNSDTSQSGEESTVQPLPVTYSYVKGTMENCYPEGYSAVYTPENCVVITKVSGLSEYGVYDIPETIDGKTVAAVMPYAFSDENISRTVKTVILPRTVKTVWSNAFSGCYGLSNVYIKSSAIEIYKDAFSENSLRTEKLILYCSKDCRNFDYHYYRTIAGDYNADYKEWNG